MFVLTTEYLGRVVSLKKATLLSYLILYSISIDLVTMELSALAETPVGLLVPVTSVIGSHRQCLLRSTLGTWIWGNAYPHYYRSIAQSSCAELPVSHDICQAKYDTHSSTVCTLWFCLDDAYGLPTCLYGRMQNRPMIVVHREIP